MTAPHERAVHGRRLDRAWTRAMNRRCLVDEVEKVMDMCSRIMKVVSECDGTVLDTLIALTTLRGQLVANALRKEPLATFALYEFLLDQERKQIMEPETADPELN